MTRLFTANGEYLLIDVEQWELLSEALAVDDLNLARELWEGWRPLSWPGATLARD